MLGRMARSRTRTRLLVVTLLVAFVIGLGTMLRGQLGISLDAESVRDYVLGLGPMAPLLFVAIVALRALLGLPSQIVLIAAGLCFGTLIGAIVGGAGLMLSGLFLFWVARHAGRETIERQLGPGVRDVLDFTTRGSGAIAFGLACGYPISPLSPLHAAAGWTPMPVANFIASAFVGGMIRAGIFAYFGDALTRTSWSALLAPVAAFAAALAIPLCFPAGRAWLRRLFGPRTGGPAER
jgi:uncharacterized membrane protein YdjX (TVP38/TMEM64 family)